MFLALNFAQMADEMMHMMSLVLRHQFLRHQATLLMVEHRKDGNAGHVDTTRTLRKYCNDRKIPVDFFSRQLRMDRCTFDILLNFLQPAVTRENIKLRDYNSPME